MIIECTIPDTILGMNESYFAHKRQVIYLFLLLFFMFRYGWLIIVQMLLKKRNARLINAQNKQGRTALHLAAGEGHDDITEFLLVEAATIERSVTTPISHEREIGRRPQFSLLF